MRELTKGTGKSTSDGGYAGNFQVFGKPHSAGSFANGDWSGDSRIPISFADGTANTIVFADKYSNCDGPDPAGTFRQGGNRWAGHGGDTWSPAFAVPNLGSDSTGQGSYFQARPDPYVGGCDPSRASSGHTQGIIVGVADGSARLLSKGISAVTWWAICTPAGGESSTPIGSRRQDPHCVDPTSPRSLAQRPGRINHRHDPLV